MVDVCNRRQKTTPPPPQRSTPADIDTVPSPWNKIGYVTLAIRGRYAILRPDVSSFTFEAIEKRSTSKNSDHYYFIQ